MNVCNFTDRFQFNNYGSVTNKVGNIFLFKQVSLIKYIIRFFSFKRNIPDF